MAQNGAGERPAGERSESRESPGKRVDMGLSGLVGVFANLTAVGLVCIMFYQTIAAGREQAREDRELFREELGRIRDHAQKTHEYMRAMHLEYVKAQGKSQELAAEIRALTQQLRKQNDRP